MFILPRDTDMTKDLLKELIQKHQAECSKRYKILYDMYKGEHEIFKRAPKAEYKPDNRVMVNNAKYIVDVFNGYFMGKPVRISHGNTEINDYIKMVGNMNDQDDNHSEISKHMDIFGHALELLYMNENADVGLTYVSPMEGFIIYDESIRCREIFGVRYYTNHDRKLEGSFSDGEFITYFVDDGKEIVFDEPQRHYFGEVPMTEYIENEERQRAFENVGSMINALNKAISEKANDVEYFADAYLKILGAELSETQLKSLRDNKIINIFGQDAEKLVADFLVKPEADQTQENLIDRLQELIFMTAMVVNYSDKNFGTASGESLSYKMFTMENIASVKERKFSAGLKRRYKLISNLPKSKIPTNEWMNIEFDYTRNKPKNMKEEAGIAKNLKGIVSNETLFNAIPSIVDNVANELERLQAEEDGAEEDLHPNRVIHDGDKKELGILDK